MLFVKWVAPCSAPFSRCGRAGRCYSTVRPALYPLRTLLPANNSATGALITIHPQQSRIAVEPIPLDSKIIVPDLNLKDEDGNRIEQPRRWRVIAVGTPRVLDSGREIPIPLQVGDEVVFDGRYASRLEPTAFYGDQKYLVVDYAGVVAKIEREPGEVVSLTPPPAKILKAILVPQAGTNN